MNCPSRVDEAIDWNPGWNQNPPFLAPDLTTCQDLNGISNARELKRASRSGVHPSEDSLDDPGIAIIIKPEASSSKHSTLKSWVWWLLSVFLTSMALSNAQAFKFSTLHSYLTPSRKVTMDQPSTELTKRSSCASGSGNGADYNTSLHVGALFIILFVSTTGCAFPMLVLKFPRLRIPASFLFTARHFGTGVLIATAFVHLLPTAFLSLGNPCLSSFWTSDYPAMPGAIALGAIFLLTVIEMVFSPGRHICSGNHGNIEAVTRSGPSNQMQQSQVDSTQNPGPRAERINSGTVARTLPAAVEGQSPLRDLGPLYGRSSSFSRTLSRMGEESDDLDRIELQLQQRRNQESKAKSVDVFDDTEENTDGSYLTPKQTHKRAVMQCVLLEMGILFHSVFIGMSLSVTVGSEFVILLIAIIFHQTFEGLALGARIASLSWAPNAIQPWLMAFTYGCTTPVGQAIGLATHKLYSPDSEVGLLLVGIMNAISSGLLVFASLVELMSEDFLSDESWKILRGKKRVYACALVFLGAFLMALVGAWA